MTMETFEMPKFRIHMSYGFPGTEQQDVIEVEDLKEAEEWAWEQACQQVEVWAEEIEEEDGEDGNN